MKYPTHLFGEALRRIRQRRSITADDLALAADIGSPNTIYHFETGKHSLSVVYFFNLLEAMEMTFDEFLTECEIVREMRKARKLEKAKKE